MHNAKTIPAPYSKDEQEFQREIAEFFDGKWGNPHRAVTREMPAARLEQLKNDCR
jgi:hypothetical protein